MSSGSSNQLRSCQGGSDYSSRLVSKYLGGECRLEVDQVVDEVRYEIKLDGCRFCEITCSPWNVAELAVGRLFVEGVLDARCVEAVEVDDVRGVIRVLTISGRMLAGVAKKRHTSEIYLGPAEVSRLSMQLETASELFHRTGGVHGVALAREGKMLAYFVDMGRHNAVDKLAGWCHLNGVDASDAVMVFSGRLPLEIMEKVCAIGCPVVVACGAPTNQSLDLAEKSGVTVVGFAKGDKFNVYTHPWRIGESETRIQGFFDSEPEALAL